MKLYVVHLPNSQCSVSAEKVGVSEDGFLTFTVGSDVVAAFKEWEGWKIGDKNDLMFYSINCAS